MKAFIIYLPSRPHSVSHATYMLQTLSSYGVDATLFKGTTGTDATNIFVREKREIYPYGIKSRELPLQEIKSLLRADLPPDFLDSHNITITEKLKLSEKEIDKISTPGVKGCFHSHYRLWRHCLSIQEPIMIFEDDVKFFRNYTPVEFEEVLILSLGKNSFFNEPYKTFLENPYGLAGAIPWKNFSMPGASGYAITPAAAKKLVKFYRTYYSPADNAINKNLVDIKIHNYLMGRNTTDDEGNVSMTKSRDWL